MKLIRQLQELRDELYRDGWSDDVDRNTRHVRDVLDRLITILIDAEAEK